MDRCTVSDYTDLQKDKTDRYIESERMRGEESESV
jgi:hypothetical protein